MASVDEPSIEDMVARFFNDLELSQDLSDLNLLLEAERRGLSNNVADHLLAEARRRGWVPPKLGSQGPLESYEVLYLGATTIEGVSTTRLPQHNEVSECIARVSSNPRVAFQTMLLMEVHAEIIRVFDVTNVRATSPKRPESLQRRTLKRLKSLTLRKITGQRRDDDEDIIGTPTESADLVVEHTRKAIMSFLSFGKVVTCITKEKDWMTDEDVYICHAYKCRDKAKAQEVADHLSLSHHSAVDERPKKERPPMLQRFTLTREGTADFGIGLAGPSMHGEAALGVYIASVAKGSVADRQLGLDVGLQVVAINRENMEDATKAEVRSAMMASEKTLVIDVQENAEGWSLRQYQAGLIKPEVMFAADEAKPTIDPAKDIESMLASLNALSHDPNYSTAA